MHQPAATTSAVRRLAPGIALSALVAGAAVAAAPLIGAVAPVPAMVIALLVGIALNRVADGERFRPGIGFCVKVLLRWAVALLGLRIALADIAALGLSTAALIVLAMVVTVVSGIALARVCGQRDAFGALAGAGTAVCGASATLATATVLPDFKGKEADIVFVVIAVNALSTLAMLLYPPLCLVLGLDATATGIALGGTIHDVAQVVGAGYAVSEPVGNTAVIVKMFRIFMLLPVVLGIGLWFSRGVVGAQVPVPVFAVIFLVLCVANTVIPSFAPVGPAYGMVKPVLVELSTWGLLVAIGALGLGTSLSAVAALGWRHVATVAGTTLVILVGVIAGLLAAG
jgi:uncharacterized integral membrane protein (TIGR00698 family)